MNRQENPRDIALALVEDGMVDPMTMLQACLGAMSWDDVRDMLGDIREMLVNEQADEDMDQSEFDDPMDGDFDSGMASAGFGTDEDYGYYGE